MKKACIASALPLFLLLATIGEAQNAANVAAYLGPRFDLPAPAGQVRFVFQNLTLERPADGRASYATLLKQGYFADGGNYGPVQVVIVTDKAGKSTSIQREKPPSAQPAAPADPVRPRSLNGSTAPQSWAMDSITLAERLEGAKRGAERGADIIAGASGSLWDFWMWGFGHLLPMLLGFGIVTWFVSKVSAAESLISLRGWTVAGESFIAVHRWSSFLLFGDLAVIVATLLIHVMVYLWASTHSFWVFIPIALLAKFGAWAVIKIIPNLPVSGTRSQAKYTETNHPRIG